MSTPTSVLDLVHYYAGRGWRVFPLHTPNGAGGCDCGREDCKSIGKHPWTRDGVTSASTDRRVIDDWWTEHPSANVGIATGTDSGLVVVDVDVVKGGDETLAELEASHGKLPPTVECLTGGGGRHLYFVYPKDRIIPNSAGKLGPGLDIRGHGGYVVGPPSVHASGRSYAWEMSSRPRAVQLATLPDWLLALLATSTNGHKPAEPIPDALIEGNRNATLTSLAGTMRRRNISVAAIEKALQEENEQRCRPPLDPFEVSEIARSVGRYQPEPDIGFEPISKAEPELRKEGDAALWLWRSLGIGIGFDLLRETSYGLQGEISVQTIQSNSGGDRFGHIHQARFNLSRTEERISLANFLTKRKEGLDWLGMLEIACYRTVELWREGEPVVDLSTLSVVDHDAYLINKLLPAGETTVMFADGGSGKSFLALALAVCVRAGIVLPGGLEASELGNVLYLDWETNAAEHNKRLERLCRGFGIPRPSILYRGMHRAISDEVAKIRKEVDRHRVSLVIVDSIGPACGGEPENAETMLRTFNALRALGDKTTRLVVSHVSRAGAEQAKGAARPFGSVFVQNMARSVWELRKAGEADGVIDIALFHRKTNQGRLQQPLGFRFEFDDETRAIRLRPLRIEDDPDLAGHATLGYRVRAALRSGAKSTKELADELESTERVIRQTIRRLPDVVALDQGSGRGNLNRYGLAAHGDADAPF